MRMNNDDFEAIGIVVTVGFFILIPLMIWG